MRLFQATIAVLCAAFLLSASVPAASAQDTEKKAGKISCDAFLKEGSALARDLQAFDDKPQCERKYHPGGKAYYENYSIGAFHRAEKNAKVPEQIWVLIFRVFGGEEGDMPHSSFASIDGLENVKNLSENVRADMPGLRGPVPATTFELPGSGIVIVCLDAQTANGDGSHSAVSLCRSAGKGATEPERLALAEDMARKDLASINP